jgi:DNA polymerase-3 subunit delta
MHALAWLKNPAQSSFRPVNVLSGDDFYLKREVIQGIARLALDGDDPSSLRRIEGNNANLADVLDELRTLPFFSKRRIVVIDEADSFITKHRKELEVYVENPSSLGVLVLTVKSWPANTKLAKLVEKSGSEISCSAPKEGELAIWLVALARDRYQCALSPDGARLLVELVGAEPGLLASEVEKLSVYVGTAAQIARGDVAKMVEAGRIETIWKALDAATTGQGAQALKYLDTLIAAGDHPIGALAGMSTSLLKLHHAGKLRAARLGLEEACKRAGIPSWAPAIANVQKQHAHLGPARVDLIPEWLVRADMDLKGGSILNPRVVLEMLLLRLAQPRHD